MAETRRDEVAEREAESEDHLAGDDGRPEERARVSQLEERHQVHPLVLSLLDEGVDPAMVSLHPPERVKVADHPCREARHPCHGLQEDTSVERT